MCIRDSHLHRHTRRRGRRGAGRRHYRRRGRPGRTSRPDRLKYAPESFPHTSGAQHAQQDRADRLRRVRLRDVYKRQEHDIFLPMMTLEELDHQKKGMSEVARNARQVSRSLDALVQDATQLEDGLELAKLEMCIRDSPGTPSSRGWSGGWWPRPSCRRCAWGWRRPDCPSTCR